MLALGVSDGVFAWREKGIDAGLFSRALCAAGATAARRPGGGPSTPLRLLQAAAGAVAAAGVQGSATACFALLDTRTGVLASANLGDSGYLHMTPQRRPEGAVRPPPGVANSFGGTWHPGGVRYRSPHQEHEFGRPFQLGHTRGCDRPEHAMLHALRLCPGDVLVFGTDGLWDNLHDSEIAAVVQQGIDARTPAPALARAVAAAAHERSVLKRGSTPYSLAATDAFDMVYSGGKRDDITVLVVLLD